jgi:hypothetical protein
MNPILERFHDRLLADVQLIKDEIRTWREYVRRGLVTTEQAQSRIDFATERVQLKLDLLKAGFGLDLSTNL